MHSLNSMCGRIMWNGDFSPLYWLCDHQSPTKTMDQRLVVCNTKRKQPCIGGIWLVWNQVLISDDSRKRNYMFPQVQRWFCCINLCINIKDAVLNCQFIGKYVRSQWFHLKIGHKQRSPRNDHRIVSTHCNLLLITYNLASILFMNVCLQILSTVGDYIDPVLTA